MSLNFGRPDMERFITDTFQGTAVTPEWADKSGMSRAPAMEEPPPARQKYVRQSASGTRGVEGSLPDVRTHSLLELVVVIDDGSGAFLMLM